MSIKRLIFLPLILVAVSLTAPSANASVVCENMYGGGQNCVSRGEIDIDKKVKDPKTGNFVDNLSINQSRFHSGNQITFELKVTNTGDATLSSVDVKDIIPEFVSFVSGPGSFDANTRTLTYNIKDLKTKETRTETLVVKVIEEKNLPLSSGVVCAVNQSWAMFEKETSQDNSQFCIEKVTKVMPPSPIKQTPPTGPEMLPLIALLPGGIIGFMLRRRKSNP